MFRSLLLLTVPFIAGAVLNAQDKPTYTETFTGGFGAFTQQRGLDTFGHAYMWANTNKAGGAAAGEFGGIHARTDNASGHIIIDPAIGDVSRLDHLTISGKFLIEENLNCDGWFVIGFANLALTDANPIAESQPFLGINITEPGGTINVFRGLGISNTMAGGKTRGTLPDEALRIPVGKVVTFSFEWIPDPILFGNGEFKARFDWEGGGYDSNNFEIRNPDVAEWTFDSFIIGSGAGGSADPARQAKYWVDDITYTVENVRGPTPELLNISTRGLVGTGNDIMIAGFVVGGEGESNTVLVRGIGPTLGGFGVPNTVTDPVLEVYRSNPDGSSTLVASNDDWGNDLDIAAAGLAVGAFDLGAGSLDAALLLSGVTPGAYTVQLKGKGEAVQVGLIEVYKVP